MSNLFYIVVIFFSLSLHSIYAQELNCRVVVDGQRVQTTNKEVFRDMEDAIENFMNSRKWTNQTFQPEERINCNLVITLTGQPSIGSYEATAQIQSSRPVYNTNYESLMLNFADRDWVFDYVESQPLEFSENYYNNNLTSMLGFYAFVILGIDYDSFSSLGGAPFYTKALDIVNLAQSTNIKGWQPFDSNRNRYWLLENLTNKTSEDYRKDYYNYHRQGLDVFLEKPSEARTSALNILQALQNIEKLRPNSIIKISFFDAKRDEIINIFKQANPSQKKLAYDICVKIDPSNTDKYKAMLEN